MVEKVYTGRILKRILIIFLLAILLPTVAGYYLVTYRLKSSVQYAVKRASSNRYAFDAGHVSLSLWDKKFSLKHASLVCVDTSGVNAYYSVKVKDIYFSVSSLKDLWVSKKLLIDSLSIIEPDITVQVKKKIISEARPDSFHTSRILDFLQSTLKKFNARALKIQDAAFTYGLQNGPPPFHADHISIAFYNFTKVTDSDEHILGSDNVTLSLGKQNWIIPDGNHQIVFKSLSFDGKAQSFVLDSCTFYKNDKNYNGQMVLYADKFYFNARHLPAIYKRNQLIIDTLVCINPTISLPEQYQQKQSKGDTARAVNYIFDKIHVGFIEVRNGDISVNSKNNQGQQVATKKANLSIYNLNLDRTQKEPFSTDSIKLDLSDIVFTTKDSLYQLSIERFTFKNNNAIFSDVVFGPTPYKLVDKSIRFASPQLLVKNISLVDLLHKRIKANYAELLKPNITLIDKTKMTQHETADSTPSSKKLDLFYQSLHAMSELINVEKFRLIEGQTHVMATKQKPVDFAVLKINATLLLNKLFLSDSLMDVKQSIPEFRVGSVKAATPQMNIALNNFYFQGTTGLTWINSLLVKLPAGHTIEAKNIYWKHFDWDIFQQTGGLKIAAARLGEVNVITKNTGDAGTSSTTTTKKAPPQINIERFETDKISFKGNGKTQVNFLVKNFIANNIQTSGNHLTWDSARAGFNNILIETKNMKTSVKEMNFNNYSGSQAVNIKVESASENGNTTVSIPGINIQTNLHSSDFKKISLGSITIDQPDINIFSKKLPVAGLAKPAVSKTKQPIELMVWQVKVNKGNLRYLSINGNDTLRTSTDVDADIEALHYTSNNVSTFSAGLLNILLNKALFDKKNLSTQLPIASVQLKEAKLEKITGGKLGITADIEVKWQQVALHYTKDSSDISVKRLSGNFHDNINSFNPKENLSWKPLIKKAAITEGDISYRGKKINADIASYSWNPELNELLVKNFSVFPVLNREETFKKIHWQADYITVKGELLRMNGISLGTSPGDSTIYVKNVSLGNIDMNTSRDKAMPFQHGIEKQMPTKLINSIKLALKIDTVKLENTLVTYHERSAKTGNWNDIFLTNIHGHLANVNSRHADTDSLYLSVSANLFDNTIKNFSYIESYRDSLSSFVARSQLSPFILSKFSRLSMPMANVGVTSGATDTSFIYWYGNKYAAFGTLGLNYSDLKVKFYNKKDTTRGGFFPSLMTFGANLFLPTNHKKPSSIFVERDKEKFVFNYWVKAPTSGLLPIVHIKSNRKYRKQYLQKQKEYSLPVKTNNELKKTLSAR